MPTKVYLSTVGAPVDPADAKVSVFDRGFLYGDSVYETMRTSGGAPVELVRHLARLHRSAAGIGLVLPFSDSAIAEAVTATHAAAGNDESYVRVIVTRGAGPIMLDTRKSESPTLVASRSLGSAQDLPELAFLWGRSLFALRKEHRLAIAFDTPQSLSELFEAARAPKQLVDVRGGR